MPEENVQTQTETVEEQPTQQATPPEYVAKDAYDALVAKVGSLEGALGKAAERLQIVDKVAEVLVGKPATTLTKEEEAVKAELFRLIPELKHLETVPQLRQAAQGAAQTAATALTEAAFGYQLELQQQAGLPVDNPEANIFIGEGIKGWINQDNTRRARFWRGDKTVIDEGFKKVQSTLSLGRRTDKQNTMQTVNARPKNSAPSGGAPSGTEAPALNFQDPKSVRAAFKAALTG